MSGYGFDMSDCQADKYTKHIWMKKKKMTIKKMSEQNGILFHKNKNMMNKV